MMSREDAQQRWAHLIGDHGGVTFDVAFARLERARAVVNGQIDMGALSRAVLEQRQELIAQNTSADGMYVSTVHRSKGLEFDEVYLFDPSGKRATWQGNPEEVRVVYVAATRAKSRLTLIRADPKALGMGGRPRKTPVKSHPHEYDSGTGCNRIFLDGLSELDTDSLLEDLAGVDGDTCKARILARQQALWEHHAGGCCTLDAFIWDQRLIYVVPGPGGTRIPVCRASTSLASDMAGLGSWFRNLNLIGLLGTQMCALATIAYQPDDDEATEYLGSGRLLMAPVLRGWGTVG